MLRRTFLSTLALSLADSLPGQQTPRFSKPVFTLGVASGDPLPNGVVLWTRLAPEPLAGGGMPNAPFTVDWAVARDDKMSNIVKKGKAVAPAELAHSVHVEVDGLEPDCEYWYQFRAGSELSPIGRTRTAPAPGAGLDRLAFAFASCQHFETGYYTAYEHMVRDNLDLVVFLGDYIYEKEGRDGQPRRHTGPLLMTLTDYRNRYALYKGDALLQKAHAHVPWIMTWDDHEVANDYANDSEPHGMPRVQFLERRAAAYQAYYEHMPLRVGSKPRGTAMQMYRTVQYGSFASFFVLDTRQYRNRQPCGGSGTKPQCAEALDPHRTIMGEAQTRWLLHGLEKSPARWNIIANQVIFSPVDFQPGPEIGMPMDKWSGYEASRRTVLDFLAKRRPSNPVIITGDVHSNWVFDVREDWRDPKSKNLAAEFVGTSISSSGDGMDKRSDTDRELSENPHLHFFNAQRGYVKCVVTPKLWRSDYRIVPYVSRPGAPVFTRASFVIQEGIAGVHKA